MPKSFLEAIQGGREPRVPDVLACLANLSNDEVFTPPAVANSMLDLLPQELFRDPAATFLDPACKTGVFLREIAKRLIAGLEDAIPDLQERVDHILHNQLFGIAITELTSLISRRTLYCSTYPNGRYSVSHFESPEGNVRYRLTQHTWEGAKCRFCGAARKEWERADKKECHAYEFIHATEPERIFDMKFDVIISNPPYQMSVGNTSGNSSKARAIYHEFVSQAIKLCPRYIVMITPSRWMTKTTEGIPGEWVDFMLNGNQIRLMHDFADSSLCFPGVDIKGGVNYFLWDRDYFGKCEYHLHLSSDNVTARTDFLNVDNIGIVIRDNRALSIIEKIQAVEGGYIEDDGKNFSGLVSPKDFFTNKIALTSSWRGYSSEKSESRQIKCYLNKSIHKRDFGWVSFDDIPKNRESIPLHKVYVTAAGGSGTDTQILGYPFYGEPNSVCSQTYLVIGYDPARHNFAKEQCENIISYIKTRFFRYLVSIKKKTQNGPRQVYQFVPMQDFSKPWTDAELYQKYGLSEEEIGFIESMIREM